MRTRVILKPGQRGTKRLVEQYGDELLCVRYRYDETQQKRYKTIELVVEQCDWKPSIDTATVVNVQVAYVEKSLQRELRQAGGLWNPTQRVWEIRYDRAIKLGLRDRIVKKNVSTNRNKKASTNRS